MANVLSYKETVKVIQDFSTTGTILPSSLASANLLTTVETAFHLILYLRQVYPSEMFAQKKAYDVLVWQSRNPALNEYLGRVVKSVGEELGKGTLKKVALVIREAELDETPLERFVFDFDWLLPPGKEPSALGGGGGHDWTPKENGLPRIHLHDHLRAMLLKLSVADTYLLSLPKETTFAVVIEMKEDAPRPESEAVAKGVVPTEWVPAEKREAAEDDDIDLDGVYDGRSSIVPLKTTRLGMINVQMLVEEMDEKYEGENERRVNEGLPKVDRKGKSKAV
ncbi:mitotic spindle assembly checkpoint protein MAD2B [Pseudohyphozyma bogoriensis]|nr:mitotic spindle assembly checkpoint protein MAD2B [Pseudohyphozyma bogoriensis]